METTAVLHIHPEYSIEIKIYQFPPYRKNPHKVDIDFNCTYRVKLIVDYVNGIDTWDETLGHSVKTMRQEDWSNQTFGTYDHAWHHVERLNEKYKELANKDE